MERLKNGSSQWFDHSLWCWGMGNVGQLGNGAMESEPVRMPTQVGSSDRWVRVVAGHLFTCGLTETGRLRCWGYNNRGQLGLGTMNSATPVAVVVNGAVVTDYREGDAVPEKKKPYEPDRGPRPQSGYIGLQNHDPKDVVLFREISVKRLPKTAASGER